MTWTEARDERRQHLELSIQKVQPRVPEVPKPLPLDVSGIPRQLLPAATVSLTETPPEKLLALIANGEVSSERVIRAFLQRAGLASRLVNCVTELLPEEAISRAQFLDRYLREHGGPIGPLHGLPISAKEHMAMKGHSLNAGYAAWVDRIARDSASLHMILEDAGCIFFARTTQPQTLMHLETHSNLYGPTTNPFNTSLTAGGSSGGEGALIGLRGSCLGIGTDIGGSIRSPAAANGVFGLKPTSHRLPLQGFVASKLGQEHITPTAGPISTSLQGIKIFMKAIIDREPWISDPSLLPLPWSDLPSPSTGMMGNRRLRVGVMTDDAVVMPHPPILRALHTIRARLERASNFDIVEFPPLEHAEAWRILSSLYFTDGGAEDRDILDASGEPMLPLSEFILSGANVKALQPRDIWKLVCERDQYRSRYQKHWDSCQVPAESVPDQGDEVQGIDVLLCPAGPGCAPPLGSSRYWGYTAQWNLLDYPCLVFPTGLTSGLEDTWEPDYTPRNEDDAFNHQLCKLLHDL